MRIVFLICALCAAACASTPGRLESNRFQSDLYPYALFYGPTGNAEYPLGAHYTVENFYSPDGRHRYPKLSAELTVDRTYRDEQPAMVGREPFYDLLLSRDAPAAKIWLRSVPLAKADRDAQLGALAARYLDAAHQTARVEAPFGLEAVVKSAVPAELRNVRTRACELSHREALRLDFELKNAAATSDLDAPEWLHASVVLIRSGYFARVDYPVLLFAGRTSSVPADETLDRDFDRVLDHLVLGDKGRGLSMKGGHTCGSVVPPSAAEAAPAEATSGDQRAPTLEVPIIQEDAPAPALPPAEPAP